jgi:hypothetical protein
VGSTVKDNFIEFVKHSGMVNTKFNLGFTFFQKKKREKENENTGFITCSEQDKMRENFTLFGRLKDGKQSFFKYF